MGCPPEAICEPAEGEVIKDVLDVAVVLEELRLVDEAEGEAIADVGVRRTVIATGVVGVEGGIAAVEGAVGAADLTGVRCLGPGVVGQHFEAVAEGTTDGNGEGVVPGVGDAEAGVDGGDGGVAAIRLEVDGDGEDLL